MNNNVRALARVCGSEKYPRIHGMVSFRTTCQGVLVAAEIYGLPDENGIFAFHIHDGQVCDDNFAAAGSHYDTDGNIHPHHSGDLPPLFGNGGYAWTKFITNRFTVDEIIGKVIIIHRDADDFTTQPAGNSGEKIACGKIRPAKRADIKR